MSVWRRFSRIRVFRLDLEHEIENSILDGTQELRELITPNFYHRTDAVHIREHLALNKEAEIGPVDGSPLDQG